MPNLEVPPMLQTARYVRLFADEDGVSHFADVDVGFSPVDYAPPAPPLHVGQVESATGCFFLAGPADWGGEVPHPSPRRQLMCMLRGELDVTASDGETRRFSPGGVVLLDDTTGDGHATRVVGGSDFLMLGVALSG